LSALIKFGLFGEAVAPAALLVALIKVCLSGFAQRVRSEKCGAFGLSGVSVDGPYSQVEAVLPRGAGDALIDGMRSKAALFLRN
jgi:hypothetical protein